MSLTVIRNPPSSYLFDDIMKFAPGSVIQAMTPSEIKDRYYMIVLVDRQGKRLLDLKTHMVEESKWFTSSKFDMIYTADIVNITISDKRSMK